MAAGLSCLVSSSNAANTKAAYIPRVVEQSGTYYLRNDGVIVSNGKTFNSMGWHSGKNGYPVAVNIDTNETATTADDTVQAYRFLKGNDLDWHFPW